jgi:hypothetical protein
MEEFFIFEKSVSESFTKSCALRSGAKEILSQLAA